IDWGAPITLVGETRDEVADAQRELARIGIDKLAAAATGKPEELAADPAQLRSTATASFTDLAAAQSGQQQNGLPLPDVILDVRTNNEYGDSHVDNAVHIPLYELTSRAGELPSGTIWVHCGSGYRAAVAASLLERDGRTDVVVVDDHFDVAADSGVRMAGNGP
ncbi:MAG: MBL fold metallo-hydrolase, partial [Actinophytocola sp.]|nr:MBL fold metallo-hydrolase [Actinophytocola sp.]